MNTSRFGTREREGQSFLRELTLTLATLFGERAPQPDKPAVFRLPGFDPDGNLTKISPDDWGKTGNWW
jgi:hypothetical protein